MNIPPVPDAMDELNLAWWTQDPERWELLRFEGIRHKDGYTVDRWWKDREGVLEALIRTPEPADRDLALFLLEQEALRHRNSWGFSHSIEIAAILVAEHRHVDDVWPLWDAIRTSFDTWCGIPHRLLVAGGVNRTLEHIANSSKQQRDRLLEQLQELVSLTDDDVTSLLAERRRHYADVLDELATGSERQ
jgi:hypothetical protein